MSQDKYNRLQSAFTTEFEWIKTNDGDIIVRDKEDGEIFLFLERPYAQRDMIADAYHAGFTTGITLKQRYIDFLESLTYQLMPGHIDPPEYLPDYEDDSLPAHVFVADPKGNETGANYAYEIYIEDRLLEMIGRITKQFDTKHIEEFYAAAASIWIEGMNIEDQDDIYAAPNNGNSCTIFIKSDDHDTYHWMSAQTRHTIRDLLYTAVKMMARNMDKMNRVEMNAVLLEAARPPTDDDKGTKTGKRRMTKVFAGNI